MSVVNVAFGQAAKLRGIPVFTAQPHVSENLNGASEVATTGSTNQNDFCRISTDTAIWVTFGSDPTASAGTTLYIPAGTSEAFGPLAKGLKCSVIDA